MTNLQFAGLALTVIGAAVAGVSRWPICVAPGGLVHWLSTVLVTSGIVLLIGIFRDSRPIVAEMTAVVVIGTVVMSCAPLLSTRGASTRERNGAAPDDDDWDAF